MKSTIYRAYQHLVEHVGFQSTNPYKLLNSTLIVVLKTLALMRNEQRYNMAARFGGPDL